MEETLEDEKKPFDEEHGKDEDQPDPDEEIMLNQGGGRVWSVKIPKHLMEKWKAVDEDNVHLATIRVYAEDPQTKKQRIVLILPPDPTSNDQDDEEYELDMVNPLVENQIVVAEREKSPGSRARTAILTGRIKHDCNLRPSFTENYRKRMKARNLAANTPKRTIERIGDVVPGGRGGVNMLSSGVVSSSSFSSLVKSKPKPAKGTFERFARMPKNQLLDILFSLFAEKSHWSAKDLRSRTEQPEAYLKEVLAGIADLHRSGEFNGLYELKPNYKEQAKADPSGAASVAAAALGSGTGDVEMGGDDDDDEDSDDDDMEEVS